MYDAPRMRLTHSSDLLHFSMSENMNICAELEAKAPVELENPVEILTDGFLKIEKSL